LYALSRQFTEEQKRGSGVEQTHATPGTESASQERADDRGAVPTQDADMDQSLQYASSKEYYTFRSKLHRYYELGTVLLGLLKLDDRFIMQLLLGLILALVCALFIQNRVMLGWLASLEKKLDEIDR